MTLCKFRPQRTYDAQWLFDRNDVHGLMKSLRAKVAELGEDGDWSTPYYVGALLAFEVMFGESEAAGEVDMHTDFMQMFGLALGELGGEES